MKETLESLWSEYFSDECAVIDTDEERRLAKKAEELYEKADALLDKKQEAALEEYVAALCDIEALFVKKAFFKGCEFAVSFLLETRSFGK